MLYVTPVAPARLKRAFANVKYSLFEPSLMASVVNTTTPVNPLTLSTGESIVMMPVASSYEPSPETDIASLALASVKYKLDPSVKFPVF